MNLDITNYEHYRLTSHGGKSFDLFNRKTDKVMTLNKEQYEYCKRFGLNGCFDVEGWKRSK